MKVNEQLDSRYYGDKHAATMCAAFPGDDDSTFETVSPESHAADIAIAVIAALLFGASIVLWFATA